MAASWLDDHLIRLSFGHREPGNAVAKLEIGLEWLEVETVAMRRARRLLCKFANGEAVSFDAINICLEGRTPFQQKVVRRCRQICWGKTLSYGELAAKCGSPRAARAVGSVMRTNRHPLIVPCHRVIAAKGEIGGYSARDGVATKRLLLAREAAGRQT